MARFIPINNWQKGMHTDDYRVPGTARWLFDWVPFRGILRRRGPAKSDSTSMFTFPYSLAGYPTVPRLILGRLKMDFSLYGLPIQHAHIPGIGEIASYGSNVVERNPSGTWVSGTTTAFETDVSFMHRPTGDAAWTMPWFYTTGTADEWNYSSDKFPRRWIPLPDGEALGFYGGATHDGVSFARWGGSVSGVESDNSFGDYRAVTVAGSNEISFRSNLAGAAITVPACVVEDSYINFDRKWHRIIAVETNIAFLATAAYSTNAAATFVICDIAPLSVSSPHQDGVAKFQSVRATSVSFRGRRDHANRPGGTSAAYHHGRLFIGGIMEGRYRANAVAALYRTFPTRIRWSGLPAEGGDFESGAYKGIEFFHDDAYMEAPGEGGTIRALASYNDQLVILRDRAVQIFTGIVATNGTNLGGGFQTISTTVGCKNVQTWDVCEHGVVFADDNGVYIWDGRQIKNLVADRIEEYWRTQAGPAMVCVANERMIVTFDDQHDGSSTRFENLSYLFNKDAWFGFFSYTPISRLGAVDRDTETYWTTPSGSANTTLVCQNLGGHYDDKVGTTSGYNGDLRDNDTNGLPAPEILTQPVELIDGIQNGRVTDIMVADAGFIQQIGTIVLQCKKGPAYQGAYGSGDMLDEGAAQFSIEPPSITTTPAARTTIAHATTSDEATHVSVLLDIDLIDDALAWDYRLTGFGLVVDDESRVQV